MPLPKQKDYTIEDIYALPDGERAELIDGQIYYMAPPTRTHQRNVTELTVVIHEYIKKNHGKCEVNVSPFAVFLDSLKDKTQNYVEPDISVICDNEKLDDKGCHGSPDWVIEVVSPSSRRLDYGRKQALYLENAVKEYWVVDAARQTVTVYNLMDDWIPSIYGFADKVRAGLFEGLEIDFTEMKKFVGGE